MPCRHGPQLADLCAETWSSRVRRGSRCSDDVPAQIRAAGDPLGRAGHLDDRRWRRVREREEQIREAARRSRPRGRRGGRRRGGQCVAARPYPILHAAMKPRRPRRVGPLLDAIDVERRASSSGRKYARTAAVRASKKLVFRVIDARCVVRPTGSWWSGAAVSRSTRSIPRAAAVALRHPAARRRYPSRACAVARRTCSPGSRRSGTGFGCAAWSGGAGIGRAAGPVEGEAIDPAGAPAHRVQRAVVGLRATPPR